MNILDRLKQLGQQPKNQKTVPKPPDPDVINLNNFLKEKKILAEAKGRDGTITIHFQQQIRQDVLDLLERHIAEEMSERRGRIFYRNDTLT